MNTKPPSQRCLLTYRLISYLDGHRPDVLPKLYHSYPSTVLREGIELQSLKEKDEDTLTNLYLEFFSHCKNP
jgi:hypothetical protein